MQRHLKVWSIQMEIKELLETVHEESHALNFLDETLNQLSKI